MSGRWRWTDDTWQPNAQEPAPVVPTLTEEDRPVVGRILGPDGKTAKVVYARNRVPFGIRPEETP